MEITFVIPTPPIIDANNVGQIEAQTAQWLLNPAPLHIFDFAATSAIHSKFFRIISVYRRALNKNGKHFASINLKADLVFQINQMGLDHVFNVVDNVAKAMRQVGISENAVASPAARTAPKLDLNILNPFIEGTVNVLETQANVKIQVGKPHLKTGSESDVAIAGVITMNNSELPGSIALCFPKPTFLSIYEQMVGEKHEDVSEETQDAAGELLNMIYGHAKTKLKAGGFAVDMAIPVIMVGDKLKMQVGEKGKSIVVPFTSASGPFFLEIYFKKLI